MKEKNPIKIQVLNIVDHTVVLSYNELLNGFNIL